MPADFPPSRRSTTTNISAIETCWRACMRKNLTGASMSDRRQSTACNEDWEMRHLYVIEVTPRPEKISRHFAIEDHRLHRWRAMVQSIRRQLRSAGRMWKTQIYLKTYRDRPVPDAKIAIYPFKREFIVASSSIDVQTGRLRPATFPAPTLPSANAGTSTWARWTRVLHDRRNGESRALIRVCRSACAKQ